MTKSALMKDIMRTDFALKEVILFLDTHPRCPKALAYYKEMKKKNKALTKEYEKQFGPITAKCNESEVSWDWVSEPWPWQAGGFSDAPTEVR